MSAEKPSVDALELVSIIQQVPRHKWAANQVPHARLIDRHTRAVVAAKYGTLRADLATAQARVAELERDGERLDWLAATDYEGEPRLKRVTDLWWRNDGDDVRAAIDAAKGESNAD